jgi:cyclic-di-GMP phosphodiesterase TipF (flagellum assembly factor)
MDRVLNRRLNIARLKAHHVRFIKLDAKWLIREGHSAGGIGRISHLKKQLDAAGIDLIVEKIESEEDLRELLDYSVDFGQGYLFAKPDIATARALSPRRRAA